LRKHCIEKSEEEIVGAEHELVALSRLRGFEFIIVLLWGSPILPGRKPKLIDSRMLQEFSLIFSFYRGVVRFPTPLPLLINLDFGMKLPSKILKKQN
jgi:hypothetical protein